MRDGTRRTLQGTVDRTRELGREELGSTALDMYLPVSRVVAEGNHRESCGLPFRVILNFVPDDIGKVPGGGDVAVDNLPDRDFLRFVGDIARDEGGEKSLLQPSLDDQIDAGQTAILVSHSDAAALAHPLQRILGSPELRR